MRLLGDPAGGDMGLHSLGHASGPDLLEIIRNIAPRFLTTVHTEEPQYFVGSLRGDDVTVIVPQYGEEIALPA